MLKLKNKPLHAQWNLALLFATHSLLISGCGSSSHKSSAELREDLRSRAAQASEVNYRKPLGRRPDPITTEIPQKESSARQAFALEKPSNSDSSDEFDPKLYLSAKGSGESQRAAELDAITRLSAQIRSEVRSVVTHQVLSGGDRPQAQTQDLSRDEIKTEISTHFAYAELIELYILPRSPSGDFEAKAVLERSRYQKRVESSLNSRAERLKILVDRMSRSEHLHDQVSAWSEVNLKYGELYPQLIEYAMVLNAPLKVQKDLEQSIAKLRSQLEDAKSKLVILIEIHPNLSDEMEALNPYIQSLFKNAVSSRKVKVQSPGQCLPKRYRLQVKADLNSKVHPVTGGKLNELSLSATLLTCPEEMTEAEELKMITLPILKGTERYQSSANQQLIKQLKQLSTIEKNNSDKKDLEFDSQIQNLLNLVLPIF